MILNQFDGWVIQFFSGAFLGAQAGFQIALDWIDIRVLPLFYSDLVLLQGSAVLN